MINNNELNSIQNLIYQDKDYDKAIDVILSSDMSTESSYQLLLGISYFYKYDFAKSAEIFAKISEYYKLGYCKLLLGKHTEALQIWKQTQPSPAQNWGIFFCELFTENITTTPTYLEVRSFLERDLNLFLKLNLAEYVQKIIDISDFLFEINPEANKFIAKAFLYNNYPDYAKEYLDRALDYTDKDAELYYLLGLYNIATNQTTDAKYNFKQALKINKTYFPAINAFEKIK